MRYSTVLAAVVGSAVAAPASGTNSVSIDASGWTVRADWSRCANADASEVVLQGHVAATGVTAGTGIVDFDVPGTHVEPAFNGTLVLKPKGTVGYGSPYPPDRVEVTVLPSASGDGDYGIAAYVPAKAGTGGSSEKIANIAWFHDKNNAINPASQITADSIARNVEIKAYTNKNPSYLRVYYCSSPQLP